MSALTDHAPAPDCDSPHRSVRRIAFGLLLLAVAARLPFFFLMPVYTDEAAAYNWYCAEQDVPVWYVLRHYPAPNNHVLHSLATTAVYSLTGLAYPWLRLPAFIAGCLAVPMCFIVFRRSIGMRAAALAAALLCASPWAMHYGIESRGYSLVMLLALGALHLLVNVGTKRAVWFAGALVGLALFTVPTALHVALGLGVFLVLDRWRTGGSRGLVRREFLIGKVGAFTCATVGMALLCYLPMIRCMGIDQIRSVMPLPLENWQVFFERLPGGLAGAAAMITAGPLTHVGFAALALIGVAAWLRDRNDGKRMALLLACMCSTVLILALLTKRITPPRGLTHLLPFACAAAGSGLAVVWQFVTPYAQRRKPLPAMDRFQDVTARGMAVVTVALAALAIPYFAARWPDPIRNNPDVSSIARAVQMELRNGATVIAPVGVAERLTYHLHMLGVHDAKIHFAEIPDDANQRLVLVEWTVQQLAGRLRDEMTQYDRTHQIATTTDYRMSEIQPQLARRVTLHDEAATDE